MEYKVLFSDAARVDIKDIYEYIADVLLSQEAATNTTRGILASTRALSFMPKKNPVYRNEPWKSHDVRFTIFKSYMVFYKVDDTELAVTILRIMYGGRDVSKQLNEDKL